MKKYAYTLGIHLKKIQEFHLRAQNKAEKN